MENEKRLIDAMQTVTKLSGRITPLIRMGANPMQIYNEVLQVIAEANTVDAVEMPCKIGDTVHRKDGQWTVVGFECDRAGSWRVKLERWKDRFGDCHETTKVVFKSFGKTVFLSSEEAKVAFAKMDGDGNG